MLVQKKKMAAAAAAGTATNDVVNTDDVIFIARHTVSVQWIPLNLAIREVIVVFVCKPCLCAFDPNLLFRPILQTIQHIYQMRIYLNTIYNLRASIVL